MLPDLAELQHLLRNVAREELLPRFNRVGFDVKADGTLLTEADLAVDRRLRRELARRWPAVAFLSEEMETDLQSELLGDRTGMLWCLDPLDGTSNFAAGIPFFGVSLALLAQGEPVLGVIHDPVRDESFAAARGAGARLNGRALRTRPAGRTLKQAIALVDFKRLEPALAARLARETPYGSQRNFGSCALEWGWMAAGRGHVCLHGGQKLWDYAAGVVVLEEAGGLCSTLAGEPIPRAENRSRSVVSSPDADLFTAWYNWLTQT